MRRAAALALALVPGCFDPPWDSGPFAVGAPIGTRESIVWPNQTHQELIVAVPDDEHLVVTNVPVGNDSTAIQWIAPTLDGAQVLAMVVPASEKIEDVDDKLVRIAADGRGEPTELAMRAPFSSLALGPDGRRAVLHFGNGPGTDVLQNANQVALVDLSDDSVRDVTLNGFGGQLDSVQFPAKDGAPVLVGGIPREIIAFLAEGELVLVDAIADDLDQVAVRFFPDVAFSPIATHLRAGNERFPNTALFVRAESGTDVAMLTLVDQADEQTGAPGFSAQVSLVPVGDGASDFLTFDSDEAPYLVTVYGTVLSFIDIRTQQGFTIDLDGNASRLALRNEETASGIVPQLVAWAEGGTIIHQLDLDGIEDALGRRPERLTIETGIDALVWLDNDRVLVGSDTVLYVVDFPRGQVTPLTSTVAYDPASSALAGDSLLLGTPGQSWVSVVDLVTLDPESMVLDEPVAAFFHLGARDRLAVVHDDVAGLVTITDDREPKRTTSFTTWDVFHAGVLERR